MDEFLIFKTNIRHKKDLGKVAPILDADKKIIQWNIDRSDRDRVLRIESKILQPQEVISSLAKAGYFCEELPD